MGEILADALAGFEGMVDGRVYAGAFRNVVERLEHGLSKFGEKLERSVAALAAEIAGEGFELRRGFGELAGKKHLPVIVVGRRGSDGAVEIVPGAGVGGVDSGDGLDFDGGAGDDFDLGMFTGNIEMMDGVAHEIAVLHDVGGGGDFEFEGEAVLRAVTARLEADLHDALADGGLVGECSGVEDGVDHVDAPSSISSFG